MKKDRVMNKVKLNRFIFIAGLLLFLVIIGRLVFLNLSKNIDGINLSEFAKNRNTTKETLYATRGSIYDSNGEVLAQTVDSYTLIAYLDESRSKNYTTPQHVIDKEDTAKKLATVIDMDEERILKILNQKGLYQVEFSSAGKGLTQLQKEAIEKLNLPGIGFTSQSKRYYPNLDFASYTLGYVKSNDDNEMTGEMGIESYYNKELTGTNGSLEYQKDASGYKLVNSPEIRIEKIDGDDIYLTIDTNVQLIVERALNTYFESSGAKSAIFVVADAKTGKILASASRPSFDPNIKNITSYLDPLVSVAFEPGSTMKTYTYMTALEKGVYKGDDTYMSGTMELSGKKIKDWNNVGWGEITYDLGYMKSSNIGVANLVTKYINKDDLDKYLKKLGFGSKTGIELPGEVSGQIKFKYDIEVATASFGQGITTTPIQHIKALTSISNNGYLLNPTIIEKIVDSNTGKIKYQSKKQTGTKVAEISTVNKIKDLMDGVVNNSEGTGTGYHLDGYQIIGKTGTAQILNPSTGLYYSGDIASIKSFEGMYPKDNPKYIFYIALERSVHNTMPDMIKSTIKDIETYYNLTSVEADNNNIYIMENFLNKDIEASKNALNLKGISYEVIGDGNKVINQYPIAGAKSNGKVFLVTNSNNINVPNIVGYSRKSFINLVSLMKLDYSIEGNGYVESYTVDVNEEGKPIKVNAILNDKAYITNK